MLKSSPFAFTGRTPRPRWRLCLNLLFIVAALAASAGAQDVTVRVASYNIENFMTCFDQELMPERSRNRTELFRDEEDLYEVARTIKLSGCDADIIGIEECCNQAMLERFNERWLDGRYAFVKVFPGNVAGQYVGMLAKPGFEVVAVRDQFYRELDPEDDPSLRGLKDREGFEPRNLLFSRGPAFVKFRAPNGVNFWVGVTHVKSKYNNSEAVTRWRIRELTRTRGICGELIAAGPDLLVMLGDFNDDYGQDRYEERLGQNAIAVMEQGQDAERLVSLTGALLRREPATVSYHCEIKPPQYRSMIDHIFASPALAERLRKTWVVDDPIAAVASDHYPVVAEFDLSGR